MNMKSLFSKDIDIDIDDDIFQAGRRLREHPTFQRFTRTNGWCYLELIGKVDMKVWFQSRDVWIRKQHLLEIMKDHCICVSIVTMGYVSIYRSINYRFSHCDEPDLVHGKRDIF